MNQPWNEIKASSIAGVVLDCDVTTGLKIGGGTATDNTTAINNAILSLVAVGVGSIKLILDGGTLTTGLVLSRIGNFEIQGIGWTSGIFIKSGSNHDAIQNSIPYNIAAYAPTTVAPAQGGSVTLRNFMINGNRGNGTTGNSNSGNPRGVTGTYWYSNICLYDLSGVHIEDMYIYDSPTYSIRLANCSKVFIKNNHIFNPNVTSGVNNDGIHINAPATDVYVGFNHINNNLSDDAVAFNAPEGYLNGVIDRVVVEGNTLENVLNGLRVYSSFEGQVGAVIFADNIVVCSNMGMTLGFSSPSTGDLIRSLSAANNRFTVGFAVVDLQGGLGELTLSNNEWTSPQFGVGFVKASSASTVSSIAVDNCRIYRDVNGSSSGYALLVASAALTVKKLIIDGFYIIDEQGHSYAAIANVLAMTNITLSQLYVAALDYTNITALADSYTNIASISGAWQPESNIQSKTGAYTLLPTDRTVLASTTAGSFAVTLPAKSYAGQKHTIKNTGTANTLTVTGTVDGAANPTLTTLAKMTVEYDGTSWWTV